MLHCEFWDWIEKKLAFPFVLMVKKFPQNAIVIPFACRSRIGIIGTL